MKTINLGKVTEIKTGKLNANQADENGRYPFFTCATGVSRIDEYAYDSECVLVAGNGDLNVKYYKGKFNAYQRVYIIESIDKEKLNVKFLYCFLQGYIETLRQGSIGGVIKYIRLQDLTNAPLPDIKIESQLKIVELLEKSEEIVLKRQQQIEALSALKQSVFLDMFGDVTKNPYGFKTKSLTEFYADKKTSLKCGPFGSALKKSEYTNEGVPVWNMNNITRKNEFNGDVNLWITQEKFEQLESYNVENDDVIISRAGTVGKMAVVKSQYSKSIISTNLIRLRFNDELLPEFFVMLLKIFRDRVARLRTGSDGSFTHMNTKVLNSIIFPYPPIELQKKYVSILNEIKVNEQMLTHGLDNIKKLYDSLLYQAFNGELFKEDIKA